jgi:hypothetical protein
MNWRQAFEVEQPPSRAKHFVVKALEAADLLSSYVDKATDELNKLTAEEKSEVRSILLHVTTKVKDPEEVGAKAILLTLLQE